MQRVSPLLRVSNSNSQNSSSSSSSLLLTVVVSQAAELVLVALTEAVMVAPEMETQEPGLAASRLPSSEI